MFGRPSRTYAHVNYDPDGLSSVGSAPYVGSSKGGFKTYRPPISETHGHRRIRDHVSDSLPPLPPAFQSHRHRKEAAEAGQRAELDRILDPSYKSTIGAGADGMGESSSMAASAAARSRSGRTAGGLSARSALSASSSGANGKAKAKAKSGGGGVYVDGAGKVHDEEYDPFHGVSEVTRKASRRRSAFGADRRKSSGGDADSASSVVSGESEPANGDGYSNGMERAGSAAGRSSRRSVDSGRYSSREEEEVRRRLEMDRRRMEDARLARRRSMMSDHSGRGGGGSIRSEDAAERYTTGTASVYSGRARSQQGYYYQTSPLSPTFEQRTADLQLEGISEHANTQLQDQQQRGQVQDTPMSNGTSVRARTNTTSDGGDDHPRKVTENTLLSPMSSPPPLSSPTFGSLAAPGHLGRVKSPAPPREPAKERIEIRKDGSKKITGFGAPMSPLPMPLPTSSTPALPSNPNLALDVPPSARSIASRHSSERDRADGESFISQVRRPKPAERPREELFPETPAQAKAREERQRREPRSSLAVNTGLASSTRLLPEIQIVEDDDPRIIFNPQGKTTRVQVVHDHVIRGPFSHALNAQAQARVQGQAALPAAGGVGGGGGTGRVIELGSGSNSRSNSPAPIPGAGGAAFGSRRPSSVKSTPFSIGSGRGSGVIDEGSGGYLPSRWAQGDRQLRQTGEDKEAYRPKEWGGKRGDLGGREAEWQPDMKEQLKRTWKDVQTNARISLFRAKKKLERKAEM